MASESPGATPLQPLSVQLTTTGTRLKEECGYREPQLPTEEQDELTELEQLETTDLPVWQAFVNAPKRSLRVLFLRTLRSSEKPKLLRYYVNVIAQRFASSIDKLENSDVHWMIILCNTLSQRAVEILNSAEGENHDDHVVHAMRVALLALSRARTAHLVEWISEMRIETMACLLRLGIVAENLSEALLQRVSSERCEEHVYSLAVGALAQSAPRRTLFYEALVRRNPVAIDAIQCIRESMGRAVNQTTEQVDAEQGLMADGSRPQTYCWLDVLSALARNDYARYALALDSEERSEDVRRFQLSTVDQIRTAFASAHPPLRAEGAIAAVHALRSGLAQHPSELSVPASLKPLLIEIIRQTKQTRSGGAC
ncbi:hypothetical protein CCYA_CCYA01G0200 [Cyanidiococcus yangmingshanensis]|nr:hypothetical protein CCYA_CCYA01G0200 [Cyanidiococcus yangmingshanensis]